MKLDYLQYKDKNDYLNLISEIGEVDYNHEVWRNFFQTYEESDVRGIYIARIPNDTVVGTVTLIVEPKIYLPGPVVHIEDIVVAEKYRRLGIGKSMIEEVNKIAKEYDASVITVSCGNQELMEFFIKCIDTEENNPAKLGFMLSKWALK